jgi:hypothetical protein
MLLIYIDRWESADKARVFCGSSFTTRLLLLYCNIVSRRLVELYTRFGERSRRSTFVQVNTTANVVPASQSQARIAPV